MTFQKTASHAPSRRPTTSNPSTHDQGKPAATPETSPAMDEPEPDADDTADIDYVPEDTVAPDQEHGPDKKDA